ncbi:ImmA/IrrE family metallo-endopeptidase [Nesterenkonia suensis]
MDLHHHAEVLGVDEIRYVEGLSRWGRYDDRTHTITLLAGMGLIQRRSTLAHELGHAYHRHTGDGPKDERQADLYAARLLIPPSAWAWATSQADSIPALAEELLVHPRLVAVAHQMYGDYTMCGYAP